MTTERNWNDEVIAKFRLHEGRVQAPYDNPPPMVLLHTIGVRTGPKHIVSMRGLPDGEAIHVFATAHGSKRNPDWYRNIVAQPDIEIERGGARVPVRATVLRGEKRDKTLARWLERVLMIADVIRKTVREIR